MAFFFHQNMLIFGGGTAARNTAYGVQFATIPAAGMGVEVAGFTEIVNNGASATALGVLCTNLGVAFVGNFACGRTALGRGPEFIGLGINAGCTLHAVGRIFFSIVKGGISLINDISALPLAPGWNTTIPQNASADYRGVVYAIITTLAGVTCCVGFLHNLYTFEAQRSLVRNSLPSIMKLMLNPSATLGLPAIAGGCIGGDLNLQPQNLGSSRSRCTPYSVGLAALPPLYPPGAGFVVGGTTAAGNLYDYWYFPDAAAPLSVHTFPNSLDHGSGVVGGLMSDHCGIAVEV